MGLPTQKPKTVSLAWGLTFKPQAGPYSQKVLTLKPLSFAALSFD
jgi:hypothetical protein